MKGTFDRGTERTHSEPLYRQLGDKPETLTDPEFARFPDGERLLEVEIVQGEESIFYISDDNPVWGLVPGEAVDVSLPFGPALAFSKSP